MSGLRRIVLALFISVVLSGFAAAQQLATCPFNSPGGNITHIVYIHFDNVHLERDNPNVASDLEQMPNLYNFMVNNGTLLSNHHTTLISHTADNILTTETGVYGDRHGQAVANGFVAQNPSNRFWDEFPSSFTYWTDPVETTTGEDTAYSMIAAAGQNAPAPWVPFTRMGCNVGAVSIANLEMENTNGDIIDIYGKCLGGGTSCSSSNYTPQYKENTTQAASDFEGIAIHCAQGQAGSLCASASNNSCTQSVSGGIMGYNGVCAEPDNLPSEPNGYSGYMGLFGHVYVAGAICPSCPISNGRPTVNDLNGNAMTGFPGFSNISAAQTLGYVAQMLENGVPVVFSYISDLHDCHSALSTCTLTDGYFRALGPGESEYETQIQAYNQAFGDFFARLQNDGIDSSNTLFIITADEQDHFVAGPASPSNCDGVTTPCNYVYPNGYTPAGNDSPPGLNLSVGEVQGDLTQLYQQQFPNLIPASSSDNCGANSGLTVAGTKSGCSGTTPAGIFDYHYDMAPAVSFNPSLASNTPNYIRQMERATAQLTAPNPITGNTDHLTNYLVDNAGLSALHMITADPLRTPNFVMFANPSWYFQEQTQIVTQEQDYAYNHGGVAPEINTTWLGLVGPGVANNGVDSTTWSDHVDTRATLLYLTGLTDDYQGDGRVLVEDLVPTILPSSIQSNLQSFEQLAAAYKQMNAPIGAFGQAVLQGSTVALASGSTGSDTQYTNFVNNLNQITSQRNALATTIKTQLYGLEYQGAAWNPTTATSETTQAHDIAVQSQLLVLNQNASSASFGQASVGSAAPIQTLTYNFGSPTTLSAVNILTGGQPNLDYADAGSSTCEAGTAYLSGQSCTVTVAFTPSAPGLRSGAVALFEQGSNVPLAVWYLNGQGQSSAVTIDPGTQTTLATLANNGQASGTAVDGKGNVYVVDNANSQVIEYAAQTFAPTTVVSSGLLNPTAIALDGAGNLYISDTGNNRVALVPNEQGSLTSADMTSVNITGLGTPAGLAVDGSGNLYVVDTANSDVLKVPTGGGTPTTVASSLTGPHAVAVDGGGNVYISANNQVTEYPAGGGATIPIGSGFSNPSAIAVDASGTLYVADSGNSRIVRVAPGGASQANLPATGVANPQGVALDSSANVYATTGGSVYEVNRAQAAGLTFPNTNVGSISAAQTVTVSDAGNQTLNFSNVAASANFTVVPSGGTDCTSSTQLASTLQCLVAVEFAPQSSGALTGTLTLADNALSNPASAQSVQLSGGASQIAQTITFPTIPTQTYGGPAVTLSATASSGLTVSYMVTAGPATASGNMLTITGAGSVTVQASQAGNDEYTAATPVSQTFMVNRGTQTVTFSGAPATAPYNGTFTLLASTNSTAVAYITGTNPTTCMLSGPYSPVTVTILKDSGKCTFTASWGADANYNPATATQTTTAAKAASTISWAPPAAVTYGTPLSSTQLNASGTPAGGSYVYSPASGAIEETGTITLKVTYKPSNTDYSNSTDTVALQVLQAPTTTSVTSSSSTVTMNADGVATATLDFNVTSYKPTGAVTLTASTGELCSGTVSAATGNGSCKLTFTTTGQRTITATYGGDNNHTGSNSSGQAAVTVTVDPH